MVAEIEKLNLKDWFLVGASPFGLFQELNN